MSEDMVRNHEVALSGLEPDTTYYYRVESVNAAGQSEVVADRTFTTMAAIDTTPPAISGVVYHDVSDISMVIEWTTDEEAPLTTANSRL